MTYRVIKYGILVGLAILTFHQNFPIGDYCSGLVEVIAFILFGGLFFFAFAVFLTIDLVKKFKNKRRFDYVPLAVLIVFVIGNLLLMKNEKNKFWTDEELVGTVEVGDLRSGQLILYSNESFSARISYVDWSCTYTGRYTIKDNILRLERNNLEEETNNAFTTEYKILTSDSFLIPLREGIEKIKILKLGTTSALRTYELTR